MKFLSTHQTLPGSNDTHTTTACRAAYKHTSPNPLHTDAINSLTHLQNIWKEEKIWILEPSGRAMV